jgi:hypothetical protein
MNNRKHWQMFGLRSKKMLYTIMVAADNSEFDSRSWREQRLTAVEISRG